MMALVQLVHRCWLTVVLLLAGSTLGAPLSASVVRGTADIAGVVTAIELRTGDGSGEIRHRAAAGTDEWHTIVLYGPDELLPLLADTRLAFLWPAIDRWAGADLVTLRDAALLQRRRAWEKGRAAVAPATTAQGFVTTRARALLQYTDALHVAGRDAEAAALLSFARDATSPLEETQMGDWSVFSSKLASARLAMGDRDGAIELLRRSAARLIENPLALNLQVTLAAYLAEQGRSAEALAIVEQVRALFLEPDGLGRPVPGALRQIDWIRACALNGLGRIVEARALMASVKSAVQPVQRKESLFVPTQNFDLSLRADACLRDHEAVTQTLHRELEHPPLGSHAFVVVQPPYTDPVFDRSLLDRARAQLPPGPTWRTLPSRYRAALSHWAVP